MVVENKGGIMPIPQPPGKWLVGNMLDLGARTPVQDLIEMAKEYGPIFQLDMLGRPLVVVSGYDLVDELSDDKKFDKKIWAPLKEVRSFAGDGLFTAYTSEANWSKAHNILLPNFGQRAMQNYHPMMYDIAEQMVLKWERLNAEDEIDVVQDMTNLTLDTIGLCGFDYRFNSFYRESNHPFVAAMVNALVETQEKIRRFPIENKVRIDRQRQFQSNMDYMNRVVDRIIKERRANSEASEGKQDLLSYMLSGVDKKSGGRLDDLNIRYQIITFLIAGHETTSGLLSFTIYLLLNYPDVLAKAYEEVDRVLGADPAQPITYQQVNQLTYIQQILKESLRLYPTAPMYAVYPYEDTTLAGKYTIRARQQVSVLVPMLHRDKSVWGERAEIFDPENFSRAAEQKRPYNAYKPFGQGQRACIGRQFAMQEATLVVGMILQRFKLLDHNRYQLKIVETLTQKPADFKIKIRPRTHRDRSIAAMHRPVEIQSTNGAAPSAAAQTPQKPKSNVPQHHTPLLVLFGSNLGTAEEVANQIAEAGEANGFAVTLGSMDEYVNQLPKEGLVIIVTASYNGTPPDNAVEFCDWLRGDELHSQSLAGVNYTVFGCGNRDWAATFQAIPRLVDSKLAEFGANRIYSRGEGDAAEDFDGQFQNWYEPFWGKIATALNIDISGAAAKENAYSVELVADALKNKFVSGQGAKPMSVKVNRELHRQTGDHASTRSTRHIEVELPAGVSYRAGDHLGVVAHNNDEQVRRVAARFHYDPDTAVIVIRNHSNRKTFLPLDEPIAVHSLLSNYVELQDVATRKQIKTLVQYTECPPEKKKLEALCGDDDASRNRYKEEVFAKRKSLIDLLEECPASEIPFNVYLEMLPALRPRYYSIASSPLHDAKNCHITVAVVEGPARSGHGLFKGVCSTHLQREAEGNFIYAYVRDNGAAFRLPENPHTPLIMVGPGTGLAPFRGFLQERAAQKGQGVPVGQSLLFFGCRHPEQDYLYEDELKAFAEQGITELFTAFSRVDGQPKTYVQHLIEQQQEKVWKLLEEGANIYVCGDASRMAPDVRQTIGKIYQTKTGADEAAAEEWLNGLTTQGRYLVDVWAGN